MPSGSQTKGGHEEPRSAVSNQEALSRPDDEAALATRPYGAAASSMQARPGPGKQTLTGMLPPQPVQANRGAVIQCKYLYQKSPSSKIEEREGDPDETVVKTVMDIRGQVYGPAPTSSSASPTAAPRRHAAPAKAAENDPDADEVPVHASAPSSSSSSSSSSISMAQLFGSKRGEREGAPDADEDEVQVHASAPSSSSSSSSSSISMTQLFGTKLAELAARAEASAVRKLLRKEPDAIADLEKKLTDAPTASGSDPLFTGQSFIHQAAVVPTATPSFINVRSYPGVITNTRSLNWRTQAESEIEKEQEEKSKKALEKATSEEAKQKIAQDSKQHSKDAKDKLKTAGLPMQMDPAFMFVNSGGSGGGTYPALKKKVTE